MLSWVILRTPAPFRLQPLFVDIFTPTIFTLMFKIWIIMWEKKRISFFFLNRLFLQSKVTKILARIIRSELQYENTRKSLPQVTTRFWRKRGFPWSQPFSYAQEAPQVTTRFWRKGVFSSSQPDFDPNELPLVTTRVWSTRAPPPPWLEHASGAQFSRGIPGHKPLLAQKNIFTTKHCIPSIKNKNYEHL